MAPAVVARVLRPGSLGKAVNRRPRGTREKNGVGNLMPREVKGPGKSPKKGKTSWLGRFPVTGFPETVPKSGSFQNLGKGRKTNRTFSSWFLPKFPSG